MKIKLCRITIILLTMHFCIINAALEGQISNERYPPNGQPVINEQQMFFCPDPEISGYLWDVWLTVHENKYYLYYLASKEGAPGRAFDNIGLAISNDGVTWLEYGSVVTLSPGSRTMGSCGVWPSDGEGIPKWIMNLSEGRGDYVEYNMVALGSDDLINWHRFDKRYDFFRDTHWYESEGRWVGISVIPNLKGGYYGYWSATPTYEAGGLFGFGQSYDGLSWEALPPPATEGLSRGGIRELGGAAVINNKVYLLFCTDQGEMTVFIGDQPKGPFRIQEKNARVLFGNTHFARFALSDDDNGPLVVHHLICASGLDNPPRSSFAPIKRAFVDEEGIFRLTYWEGNDQLKINPIEVSQTIKGNNGRMRMLENKFDAEYGFILEGRFAETTGTRFLSINQGLYIETDQGHGIGIMVNGSLIRIGTICSDGNGFRMDSFINRRINLGPQPRFRLLLRNDLLEFYLNNHFIQSYAMPKSATGRIGIIHNGNPNCVDELKAWNCIN